MTMTRIESRSKIAIEWYDNKAEAILRAESARRQAAYMVEEGYDFGYMSIGRDPAFDTYREDGSVKEWAVVAP